MFGRLGGRGGWLVNGDGDEDYRLEEWRVTCESGEPEKEDDGTPGYQVVGGDGLGGEGGKFCL